MADFDSKRRQRFLSEEYFTWLSSINRKEIEHWKQHVPPTGNGEDARKAMGARYVADDTYRQFLLQYTAGKDLRLLRIELDAVVMSLEVYTVARRKAEKNDSYPPFMFGEIEDYESAVQLIGLCHLLHRRELLPRVTAMLDPFYRARDTLYEDLLAYGMDGQVDVDVWFHESYRDLINSMYSDTDELGISLIRSFLGKWYQAMNAASWHDSHLKANVADGGAYVGYWAIEAAAAAYLLELDDTSFRDHLLYPKDLVEFARKFDTRDEHAQARNQARVLCGQTKSNDG
ncbi:PoNe immunity protein domain-containing protein [Paraburkholderia sp. ZP32-5]|uniref:PoNe immunity protein domain-containing protein n=1 Tax=Paraburkholderia sp. ZP32-5 TaxID=2883245 RepID=UPI001F2A8190|nr:PoNe immunity protein domain-containing protein [Paraburkholderia sp. ZP32-5]